jgi:2'-5' RNA ligase
VSDSTPPPASKIVYRPRLRYLLTGWLNVLIWKLPLPHRAVARVSSIVYRNPPMPTGAVLAIVGALRNAGVRFWVSGGWGVDALVGRCTRIHRDLDMVVDEGDMQLAVDVVSALGYREWYRSDSDVPTFSRIVFHNHPIAGQAVDLHPLDVASTHIEFTTGTIEQTEIPCLSVAVQLKTHTAYKKRWRDRADIALMRGLGERSVTTLIVPVPAADRLVHESARDAGMPAHITLLYPFLEPGEVDEDVEAELGLLFAGERAFDFELTDVGLFPGVVYVAPNPVAPFVALTELLARRWPENPPYGGSFNDIVPHLTVAHGARVPSGLDKLLPLPARAAEAWLVTRAGSRWVKRASFPFGQPA